MLTVTDAAVAHLMNLLDVQEVPANIAVRLVNDGEGIALQPDIERPGDTTFKHADRTVVLLDTRVAGMLNGHRLDVKDKLLTLQPGEGGEQDRS